MKNVVRVKPWYYMATIFGGLASTKVNSGSQNESAKTSLTITAWCVVLGGKLIIGRDQPSLMAVSS